MKSGVTRNANKKMQRTSGARVSLLSHALGPPPLILGVEWLLPALHPTLGGNPRMTLLGLSGQRSILMHLNLINAGSSSKFYQLFNQ
jgi:hypothetical protein